VDHQFGNNGIAIVDNDSQIRISAAAVQRDRKVLIAGVSSPQVMGGSAVATIVRLNANGSIDPSFGNAGFRYIPFSSSYPYPIDIGIQRDGRILLTGHTTSGGGADLIAIRLLPNGDQDPSFGAGGIVLTDLEQFDQSSSLAMLDDGRFFLAGSVSHGEKREMAVVGYLPNGSINQAFANNGLFVTGFSSYDGEADVVRVLPSGDLIVAGTLVTLESRQFALAKIEGFGAPQLPWRNHDNAFNVDGDLGDNVTAADALVIIDALNFHGSHDLPPLDAHRPPAFYLDVDGDNRLSPVDALIVIDHLNLLARGAGASGGEGEHANNAAALAEAPPAKADPALLWILEQSPSAGRDIGAQPAVQRPADENNALHASVLLGDHKWFIGPRTPLLALDTQSSTQSSPLLELDNLLECLAEDRLRSASR
jgi:uncharacterized delta-60 repeat protein